jgi:hypothetical protein
MRSKEHPFLSYWRTMDNTEHVIWISFRGNCFTPKWEACLFPFSHFSPSPGAPSSAVRGSLEQGQARRMWWEKAPSSQGCESLLRLTAWGTRLEGCLFLPAWQPFWGLSKGQVLWGLLFVRLCVTLGRRRSGGRKLWQSSRLANRVPWGV